MLYDVMYNCHDNCLSFVTKKFEKDKLNTFLKKFQVFLEWS